MFVPKWGLSRSRTQIASTEYREARTQWAHQSDGSGVGNRANCGTPGRSRPHSLQQHRVRPPAHARRVPVVAEAALRSALARCGRRHEAGAADKQGGDPRA